MKITRILAHGVELPLHETTYKWSGGKSVTVFDSTIAGVETYPGLIGYLPRNKIIKRTPFPWKGAAYWLVL